MTETMSPPEQHRDADPGVAVFAARDPDPGEGERKDEEDVQDDDRPQSTALVLAAHDALRPARGLAGRPVDRLVGAHSPTASR